MSDARWLEVDDDIGSSVKHLGNAVAIFDQGVSSDDDLSSYVARMAFMQAMQAGYTSLEAAFERILERVVAPGANFRVRPAARSISDQVESIRTSIDSLAYVLVIRVKAQRR